MPLTTLTREPTLEAVERALASSWSSETSADSGWNTDNPALGQCAVSALVVQDILGGELLRAIVTLDAGTARQSTVSHWWNRLGDGTEVDMTRSQFPSSAHIGRPCVRERDYVLSFAPTVERYEKLADSVDLNLDLA